MKNNAQAAVGDFQGVYKNSSLVNGKSSWRSLFLDFWFFEGMWFIGDMDSGQLGAGLAKISSTFGNVCPFHIKSENWRYYDFLVGEWTNAAENEVNTKCLQGNFWHSF